MFPHDGFVEVMLNIPDEAKAVAGWTTPFYHLKHEATHRPSSFSGLADWHKIVCSPLPRLGKGGRVTDDSLKALNTRRYSLLLA